MFSEKKLLEISAKADFDFLIQNDSNLTSSILSITDNDSPYAFKICYRFSRLQPSGHLILKCHETACLLIEELLNPELYMVEALKTMESLIGEDLLNNPVWFYLARSRVADQKKFQNLLVRHFYKNPPLFSEVMEKTGKCHFIPSLEEYLRAITPYVKYLPLCEDSHEIFYPHDVWLRVGASYARLLKKDGTYAETFPPVIEFLENRFFPLLPDEMNLWVQDISEDQKKQWQDFEKVYWEHFEYA